MQQLIGVLKMLADETRFKIIQLLLEHDFCVGALAERLGVSRAAVSQHLRLLKEHGLVRGEKRGYWTHYMVNREKLAETAAFLTDLARQERTRSGCSRSPHLIQFELGSD